MNNAMTVETAITRARDIVRANKLSQEDIRGEVVKVYLPRLFGKMPKDEKEVLIRDMQDTGIFWLDAFNPDDFGYVLMPLGR